MVCAALLVRVGVGARQAALDDDATVEHICFPSRPQVWEQDLGAEQAQAAELRLKTEERNAAMNAECQVRSQGKVCGDV